MPNTYPNKEGLLVNRSGYRYCLSKYNRGKHYRIFTPSLADKHILLHGFAALANKSKTIEWLTIYVIMSLGTEKLCFSDDQIQELIRAIYRGVDWKGVDEAKNNKAHCGIFEFNK